MSTKASIVIIAFHTVRAVCCAATGCAGLLLRYQAVWQSDSLFVLLSSMSENTASPTLLQVRNDRKVRERISAWIAFRDVSFSAFCGGKSVQTPINSYVQQMSVLKL